MNPPYNVGYLFELKVFLKIKKLENKKNERILKKIF